MKRRVRVFSILITLSTAFSLLVMPSSASAFAGGDGSEGNPWQISTCAHLQSVNSTSRIDDHFELIGNIDCTESATYDSGNGFLPIGTDEEGYFFNGHFEGNNFTISNLTIDRDGANFQGMFSRTTTEATIQNFTLANVSITITGSTAGAAVAELFGTLSNVHASGTINGAGTTGGLVGRHMEYDTVINSSSSVDVTCNFSSCGGLVGFNSPDGNIVNSFATGDVIGSSDVGGLVGRSEGGTITNSYSTGSVSATADSAGGFVGRNDGNITGSYATGDVFAESGIAGGFVGEQDSGDIVASYALGNVEANSFNAGGFVGQAWGGTISQSYATGDVVGVQIETGGFVGFLSGTVITDAYARGDVTGEDGVGGFVGYGETNSGSITNAYSTGLVIASGNPVGGFSGSQDTLDIANAFYNGDTSGVQTDMSEDVVKSNTESMQTQSTFTDVGWDFEDVWSIGSSSNDGYPCLQALSGTCEGGGSSEGPNNGDGNNDGIQDSEQPNVDWIMSPLTSQYVVLELDDSCEITELALAAEDANDVDDAGYDYPVGLVNFVADCGEPGYETQVKLFFYNLENADFVLRKHNPNTGAFFTVEDSVLGSELIDGLKVLTVTYIVTDGGALDIDGETNGVIADPVGLGQLSVGAPRTGAGGTA